MAARYIAGIIMATSTKRRHYRSQAISIITSAVNVSIKTALLESLVKKASSQFRQSGWAGVPAAGTSVHWADSTIGTA